MLLFLRQTTNSKITGMPDDMLQETLTDARAVTPPLVLSTPLLSSQSQFPNVFFALNNVLPSAIWFFLITTVLEMNKLAHTVTLVAWTLAAKVWNQNALTISILSLFAKW